VCCKAVRSAILATVWLLVFSYNELLLGKLTVVTRKCRLFKGAPPGVDPEYLAVVGLYGKPIRDEDMGEELLAGSRGIAKEQSPWCGGQGQSP